MLQCQRRYAKIPFQREQSGICGERHYVSGSSFLSRPFTLNPRSHDLSSAFRIEVSRSKSSDARLKNTSSRTNSRKQSLISSISPSRRLSLGLGATNKNVKESRNPRRQSNGSLFPKDVEDFDIINCWQSATVTGGSATAGVSREPRKSVVSRRSSKDKSPTEIHSNTSPFRSRRSSSIAERRHSKDVRPAQMLSALRDENEQLLRALTTLAINSLTVGTNTSQESFKRIATIRHCENRDSLVTGETLPGMYDNELKKHTDEKVDSPIDDTEETDFVKDMYPDNGDDINDDLNCYEKSDLAQENASERRIQINKLRNYLKRSGYGEPAVIINSEEEAAKEKLYLLKLLHKMKHGQSPRKLERLRLKARLEYEMSMMRAESFCEQQEQVYMRTASADMENRDLQLLEEDLKYQALQDIKTARLQEQKQQQEQYQQQRRHSKWQQLPAVREGEIVVSSTDQNNEGHQEFNVGNNDNDDDDFGNPDDDGMSGLLKSPLSRKEMTKRIIAWVADVDMATRDSKDNNTRNTSKGTHDSYDEGDEIDANIRVVMKSNIINGE